MKASKVADGTGSVASRDVGGLLAKVTMIDWPEMAKVPGSCG
jgi:hypothetical protein